MSRKNHKSWPSTVHVGTAALGCPVEQSSTSFWGGHSCPPSLLVTSLGAPFFASFARSGNFGRRQHTRILLSLILLASSAFGQIMTKGMETPPANVRPPKLENVGIEQHLDARVPLDLAFRDENGKNVKLGDYFGRKPVILDLAYYNCTMLCGEVLAGLTGAMRMVNFDLGKEYDVITVSFNPKDTPELATEKKKDYVHRYGRAGAEHGWHFLTGQPEAINALTKAVGFQYQYDAKSEQYAHATAIMVLTPQGKISRYFYGVDFPPKDLRLGLVEASQNKIGSPVDAVLLYCYHYDPATGKYGAIVTNILRLGAGLTILILGAMLLILIRMGPAHTSQANAMKAGKA